MAWVRRWFRYFALWGIPFVVIALLLVCGFVYWVLASQAGTSWALRTALPAHILTPSVTSRGVVNMTALAAVEAQGRMESAGHL